MCVTLEVAVWRRLAWLRGLTRWLSGVSGSAVVHGWRCPGAVVLSLPLQPREEGPGGEDAAPLHRRAGFWVNRVMTAPASALGR